MIVEEIRKFVEEESKKPEAKYGYEPFQYHLIPMHNYAKMLAENSNADIEIVEIAAWLHDIGSIVHGRKNHHITGAKIAEEKLKELNYPQDKIERVKHCILAHRGSEKVKRETKEAEIIAEADGMSNFDNIPGIFKASFIYENLSQGEAKQSVLNKLKNCYDKISPEARKIIKPKFEAAVLLLT